MMILKKSMLLALSAFILIACSTDDDGVQPNILSTKAKVLKAELPDSFALGENYTIDVYYQLPSACHLDVGLKVDPGSTNSEFYIYGVAAYDADQVGCDQTSTDLERQGEFPIFIESERPYVFHIWQGFDEDGKDIYVSEEVEVNRETIAGSN